MSLVIGVDPGGMTGLAYMHQASGSGDILKREFHAVELSPMHSVDYVEDLLLMYLHSDIVIAVETYTVTSNTVRHARQYDALEIIGAIKHLVHRNNRPTLKLVMQQPVTRKVVSNDVLKQLGFYENSKDKHMVDAAKHMVIAAVKEGIIKSEELVVDLRH